MRYMFYFEGTTASMEHLVKGWDLLGVQGSRWKKDREQSNIKCAPCDNALITVPRRYADRHNMPIEDILKPFRRFLPGDMCDQQD